MDIAQDAIAPEAAPASPANPPLILREDYQPYPWLVPQTELQFALGIEKTRVTAKLSLERNPAAAPTPELRLNGDGLTALDVRVDGAAVNDWRMDGPDLVLMLPGDNHTIEIATQIDPSR